MGEFYLITDMSDEFIKIATKEIEQDVSEIEKTLSVCTSDADIILHASKFQKHTHKIKGLAPMMEKQDLGDVFASLDSIFKIISDKSEINGVFAILSEIIPILRHMLFEPNYNASEIRQQISHIEEILN